MPAGGPHSTTGYARPMTEGAAAAATIRRAGLDDLERLVAVQRVAEVAGLGHVFPPDRYPFPVDEVRDRWRSWLAAGEARILLAERGARAVGTVCASPGVASGILRRSRRVG